MTDKTVHVNEMEDFDEELTEEELADWDPEEELDPSVQYNLGYLYIKGWGVEQDVDKAVEWF